NSLKGLPAPLREACKIAGWKASRTFWQLEVPAGAQGLVWNGMLSMAGGWFFLMVNEAFRLGDHDYRLPGIGSYMSVARDQGNATAVLLAILAMVLMIVCVDQRSEEHTSELQSRFDLVCRLLLEKKKI